MQSPDVETVQVCVLYVCICVSGSVSTFVRLLVCAHVCMCSCQCVGAQACVCVPIQVLSIWSGPDRSSPYSLSSLSLSLGFPDWTRLGASELQGSVCLPGPRLELTSELCLTFFFLFFFFFTNLGGRNQNPGSQACMAVPSLTELSSGVFLHYSGKKIQFLLVFSHL